MFLKVKSGGKFYFVRIAEPESEEFTSNTIIISIINKVDINVEGRELQFKDRDGVEIDFDDLPEIITQYRYCSCFFIELCFDETTEATSKVNLKKELECYLKNGDFGALFSEYESKKTLSDSSRRCLVREATNFLRKRSGNYPNREDKIALAEAVICLFPSFKVENSKCGGIDLFFNPAANTGYLVAKLKNFNSKRRKLATEEKNVESDSGTDNENIEISQEDLIFFQNCLVGDQLTIKEKLQQTLKARIRYCKASINVLQAFPIFFYDSSLILFDFELRYGTKSKELLNNWPKYMQFIDEISNEAGGQKFEGPSEWDIDVLPFLNLLKLLPSTAAGRDTKKTKISKSVNSIISFEELHTPIEK